MRLIKNNLKTYFIFKKNRWGLFSSTKKTFQYTQKRKRTTIKSKGETKKAWMQSFKSKQFTF